MKRRDLTKPLRVHGAKAAAAALLLTLAVPAVAGTWLFPASVVSDVTGVSVLVGELPAASGYLATGTFVSAPLSAPATLSGTVSIALEAECESYYDSCPFQVSVLRRTAAGSLTTLCTAMEAVPAYNDWETTLGSCSIPSAVALAAGDRIQTTFAPSDPNEAGFRTGVASTGVHLPSVLQFGTDLTAKSVSGPTAATAGRSATVSYTVAAAGGTATVAGLVRMYLSADTLVDASDLLLGAWTTALAPWQSVTSSQAVTLPAGMAPGTYRYLAAVDPLNAVAEVIETNNVGVGNTVVVTGITVDLTVGAPSGTTPATSGKAVTVSGTVASALTGAQTVSALVRAYVSLDSVVDGSDALLGATTVTLAPGQSVQYGITGTIPSSVASGTYRYVVVVDPLDAVPETNEGNNVGAGNSVTVTYVNPDLAVVSVSGPTTANSDAHVTVSYTLTSASAGSPSVNALVRVYLSTDSVVDAADRVMGGATTTIAPGQSLAQSLLGLMPWDVPTGSYKYLVVVEPLNAVAETSEANNLGVGTSVAVTKTSGTRFFPTAAASDVAGMGVLSSTLSGGTAWAAAREFVSAPLATAATASGSVGVAVSPYCTADAADCGYGVTVSRRSPAGALTTLCTVDFLVGWDGSSPAFPVSCSIPAPVVLSAGDRFQAVIWGSPNTTEESATFAYGASTTWVDFASLVGLAYPDLAIASVSGPATATSGKSVTVSYSVTSAAVGTASSSAVVRVYLSPDLSVDESDVVLGEAASEVAPGQAVSGTVTGTVPANATGTLRFLALVDPTNAVPEATEENNLGIGNEVVVAYANPDLRGESLSGPMAAAPGDAVDVSCRIAAAASGSAEAVARVRVFLSVDSIVDPTDSQLGELTATIAPGQTATASLSATLPAGLPLGSYRLLGVVDPLDEVVESDEGNNLVVGSDLIVGPDLRVLALSTPSSAGLGGNIQIVDTVGNFGTSTAAFNVRYYLSTDANIDASDTSLGTRALSGIVAGGTSTATTTVTLPTGAEGLRFVGAVADPGNQVLEANEDNNSGTPVSVLIGMTPLCRIGMVPFPTSNPCVMKVCDPLRGLVDQRLPTGTACSDASACNGMETCDGSGVCVAGAPLVADDGNACTLDYCSASVGVHHVALPGCDAPPSSAGPYEMSFSYDGAGNMVGVVNLSSDVNNCGALGNVCSAADGGTVQCIDGGCWLSTPTDFIDLESDVTNCGTVGNVCPGRANGYPECNAGVCGVRCLAGFAEGGEVCVDVGSDPANCGTIGNACATPVGGVAVCAWGTCDAACAYPFAKVDLSCVDLMANPDHCGEPYNKCEAPAHGAAACTLGTCDFVCEAPYTIQGDICVDLQADPYNCGTVGNVCDHAADGSGVCRVGGCVVVLGAPAVTSVNGVPAPSSIFRMRQDHGLTLAGENLDRVTRVELEIGQEDWVSPDPLTSWYRPSEPVFSGAVYPEAAGPVSMAFTAGATSIVVTGGELIAHLNQGWWIDPHLRAWTWYRLRLHYLNEGLDQVSVVDLPFSIGGPERVDLSAPNITGIDVVKALTSPTAWGSEPVELALGPEVSLDGLLWVNLPGTNAIPVSFLSSDLASEHPVTEVLYRDGSHALVRIDAGVDLESLFHERAGSEVDDVLMAVVPYVDDPNFPVLISEGHGLLVRGTNLGAGIVGGRPTPPDGPLNLADSTGAILRGIIEGHAFADYIVVPPGYVRGLTDPSSFIVFQSARGATRTPLHVNWADAPRAVAVRAESIDPAECVTEICPDAVPYDEGIHVTGYWLDRVTSISFCGPASGGVGLVCEPLVKVVNPDATLSPGQYAILAANQVRLKLSGGTGQVARQPLPPIVNGVYLGGERFPGSRWITWSTPEEPNGIESGYAWAWRSIPETAPHVDIAYAARLADINAPWFWWYEGDVESGSNYHALLTVKGFDARFDITGITLYPFLGTQGTVLTREEGFLTPNAGTVVVTQAALAAAMAQHPLVAADKGCHDFGAEITLRDGNTVVNGLRIKYCDYGLPLPEPEPIDPATGITVGPDLLPDFPSDGGCTNSMCF